MSEPDSSVRTVIPEHLMLSRLSQSEQMREFFIQMWLQNPALAKQGGSKVQDLLRPHPAPPTPALPKPFADLKSAGQALSATHTLDCGSFVTVAAGAGHVGRE